MPEPTPDETAAAVEAFLGVHPAGRGGARDDLIERVWADRAYELRAVHLRALLDDRFAMLDLLAELVAYDGRECAVEPDGECAPHAYPTGETGAPCPYRQARDMLAAAEPGLERRRQDRAGEARGRLEGLLDAYRARLDRALQFPPRTTVASQPAWIGERGAQPRSWRDIIYGPLDPAPLPVPEAERRSHCCDERCACPADGLPMHYAPSTGQHACQDPDCEHAHHGGPR